MPKPRHKIGKTKIAVPQGLMAVSELVPFLRDSGQTPHPTQDLRHGLTKFRRAELTFAHPIPRHRPIQWFSRVA